MSDLSEYMTVNYKYKRRSAADIYHCFSKQDEAIEYANSEGNSTKVFSYEVSRGKRRFISCSAGAFWDMYDKLPEEKKKHYEVIVSTHAVKLFFDIEFSKVLNCEKDGPQMVKQFVNLVNTRLHQMCDSTSVPENVLVLDSSNDVKFSCHLVFSEAIFSNYEACRQFVLDLVKSLSEEDRLMFEVKDRNENKTLMTDLLVYTRNRNMRLIGSSKFGERRPIMLSEDDLASVAIVEKLHLGGSVTSKEVQKEVFMKSLITNVCDDCSMITCYPSRQQQSKQPVAVPSSGVSGTAKSMTSSSHPKLDSFITDLVSPGRIRKVLYNKETIRFEVAGNRRCQKIGRDHTSNHIFYVYYKTSEKLFQDCYSPSCTSLDPIEIMIN